MLTDNAATDWLGTHPVFYNEITGAISHNIHEVIDYSHFSLHAEGVRNFLSYGYSVFGQTPIMHVKALPPCSGITRGEDGSLTITELPDPVDEFYGKSQASGAEVFEHLTSSISEWISKQASDTDIILPLSGGLDSRLLAYSGGGDERIRTYSYGYSHNQRRSHEVVKGSMVASSLNLSWKHIPTTRYYSKEYLDRWYHIYGPAIHMHGMYQMEFYDRILSDLSGERKQSSPALLSGIIGDGWAGTVRIGEINTPADLSKLGYTHGTSILDDICILPSGDTLTQEFFEHNKDKLREENWRIIYAMRFKMMLLSYLLRTPESLGITPWSPFLDPKLAMEIVDLPWDKKTDRRWEHEEFAKRGLDIGWEKRKCDYTFAVECENHRFHPLAPLDAGLLSQIVKPDYVEHLNKTLAGRNMPYITAHPRTPANLYNKYADACNRNLLDAINHWQILAALERLLKDAENGGPTGDQNV